MGRDTDADFVRVTIEWHGYKLAGKLPATQLLMSPLTKEVLGEWLLEGIRRCDHKSSHGEGGVWSSKQLGLAT